MAKWIQRVFDFYLDNKHIDLEKFVTCQTPKVLMYDATDEIINHFASLPVGITNILIKKYFLKGFTDRELSNSGPWKKSDLRRVKCAKSTKSTLMLILNKIVSLGTKWNQNFRSNDKLHREIMENVKMSRLIISDNDCWILFLAFKR